MKIRAAFFGSILLLSSVGVAHAQRPVQSDLTLNLTMNVTTTSGSGVTNVKKVRFNTKDFLNLLGTATGQNNLKSAVLLRITDPTDPNPPIDFLNQRIFVRNSSKAFVDVSGALSQTPLPVAGPLGATATEIRTKDNRVSSRKNIGNEGTTWTISAPGGTSLLTLSFAGMDTLQLKSLTENGRDQGLAYTSRQSDVNGGSLGVVSASAGASPAGTVTGTVKANKEKAVDDISIDVVSFLTANPGTGVRPGDGSTTTTSIGN